MIVAQTACVARRPPSKHKHVEREPFHPPAVHKLKEN
jgi:hypothetical protein